MQPRNTPDRSELPSRELVSVIICTHNPRRDYLDRVLRTLGEQTLSPGDWELLLIDNASDQPLASRIDLRWHPKARHFRVDRLGLTNARLHGIRESGGELLIVIDDDNVLAGDYLRVAIEKARTHPHIGAFGGSIKGEFETPPPAWIHPYLSGMAISEIDRDYWSNVPRWSETTPYGAGMCIRRCVAEDYADKVGRESRRRALDRVGRGMGSGGDTDLALCATDLGMGTARFHDLRLTHLIPSQRLTEDYVTRLYAGFAAGNVVLGALRARAPDRPRDGAVVESLRWAWRFLRADNLDRRIMLQSRKADADARRFLAGSSEHGSLLQT